MTCEYSENCGRHCWTTTLSLEGKRQWLRENDILEVMGTGPQRAVGSEEWVMSSVAAERLPSPAAKAGCQQGELRQISALLAI